MSDVTFKDIMNAEVRDLVFAMYNTLIKQEALPNDTAKIEFGNANFHAELKVNLKNYGQYTKLGEEDG